MRKETINEAIDCLCFIGFMALIFVGFAYAETLNHIIIELKRG